MSCVLNTGSLKHIILDQSGLPKIVIKCRHIITTKQKNALCCLYNGKLIIHQDRSRFLCDDNDEEMTRYIQDLNQYGIMVYVTAYSLASIKAFEAGCRFGTFQRFEESKGFNLRSIAHYNCDGPLSISKVLCFANERSKSPTVAAPQQRAKKAS